MILIFLICFNAMIMIVGELGFIGAIRLKRTGLLTSEICNQC